MSQEHRVSVAAESEWVCALRRSIWPVVARINGEWQPSGTGFFIGREGLLITAWHIIEPAARKRGRFLNAHGKWADEGQFFVISPNGSPLLPIAISNIPDRGDIAVCQTRRPRPDEIARDFSVLALSPGVPKIGERVYVMGYRKFDPLESWPAENHCHTHFDAEALIVTGSITELHIPERDRVMAPFPCFTIDAEIHGGMSGAPVINEAGFVCGMVSMSPTWSETATCALVGMAMATSVDLMDLDGVPRRAGLLYDLVREGRVASDQTIDHVILHRTEEGATVSVMAPG